jgi:hypothetical protein
VPRGRLPNAGDAVIDARKLRDYLLSATHPTGRFKAQVFRALGYTSKAWRRLERDPRRQHLTKGAVPVETTEYGREYEIRAKLRGPNGRSGMFVSAWIIELRTDHPRLLTVYPGDR